jgi:hypothetical protein
VGPLAALEAQREGERRRHAGLRLPKDWTSGTRSNQKSKPARTSAIE